MIPPKKTPERKRTSAQAHFRLSLLLRKQPISELGGDQWEARMRGPASLNAPRRKEVDSVESGVGELFPESEGFLSEAEGRVSDPRHQRREPTKGKLWSTVGGPAGSEQSCGSRRAGCHCLEPESALVWAGQGRVGVHFLYTERAADRDPCVPRSFERCTRLRGSYPYSRGRWTWVFLQVRTGELGRPA